MKLRNITRAAVKIIGLLFIQVLTLHSWGQCPPAACQPGSTPATNLLFGMGIYQVQLANLDTITNGAADGYRDYSCQGGARLQRGNTYILAVRTNPNADENVRAWVDFDNNGQFSAAELVLTSTARQHQSSFTVPNVAVMGLPLRLRIAADYVNAPLPTACSTPQYSQTEDYRVIVTASAPARPIARFAAVDSVTCGNTVMFRDQSFNTPTGWRWAFGDGLTSTQQYPQHTYAVPGTYAVSLRACNATGCDSLTKLAYILVRADVPRPAPCQPATAAYCCGFGITRVQVGGLNHSSLDGRAGYEDFSCAYRTTLTADRPITFQLTTGPNAHDVRVYLDLNDNGRFDLPGEMLFEGLAVRSPSVIVQVAGAGVVYNRPLRLRVLADAAGTVPFGPCISPSQGQVEDYAIVVLPNLSPPSTGFTLSYQQACQPVQIALTNTTSGGATSYEWDFGDGSTVTATQPAPHTYAATGLYEVQLIARNANGADTVRRIVAVAACPTSYCAAGGLGGTVTSPASFTRVQFGTIDNTTTRTYGTGYYDFTNLSTELQAEQTYTLHAESLPWQFSGNGPWAQVAAWVDWNQDGLFSPAEEVGPFTTFSPHLLTVRVPGNAKLGATRLRVRIQDQNPLFNDSCSGPGQNASTEDYIVVVIPAPGAPQVGFRGDLLPSCSGLVQFRDTSRAGPTQWSWSFGDGATSTLANPVHRYATPGTYTVALQASNRAGRGSISRTAYAVVSAVNPGPAPAACLPHGGNTGYYWGIGQLSIGASFAYTQPPGAVGYADLTCSLAPLRVARGTPTAVSVQSMRAPGVSLNYYFSVYMWLDGNDDGVFTAGELVYSSGPFGTPQVGTLTVPATVPLGQPLRLRVYLVARPSSNGTAAPPVPGSCERNEAVGQVRDFALVATATPTAVLAPGFSSSRTVYPNPTHGPVTLPGPFIAPVRLSLHNALGQVIREQTVAPNGDGQLQWDVSGTSPGLYMLHVAGQSAVSQLVVW